MPSVIYIQKGSINKIITQLNHQNIDLNRLDSFILRYIGDPQSGYINIKETKLTKADFLYKLTKAKSAIQSVTLIPGETTYFFLDYLSKELKLNREKLFLEFKKQSPFKEGAFIADTYNIPKGLNEQEVISILLKLSKKRREKLSKKLFGKYDEEKLYKYIIVASIIQKEAASKDEMPIIASVIYNRLKKKMRLQMDGTLNYGKYSHTKVTAKRIRNDNSKFNTYKFSGLPSVPICNTSVEAIVAALHPVKSNYLYFMKNKNGKHDFTCYYSTHLNNIKHATK